MTQLTRLLAWIRGSTTRANPAAQLLASLLTMAWFVEARDPYTGGHLWRVSRYARLLAERAGLPHDEVARIELGGFLHDLGKVGVPDAILRKKDRLSDEEYAVIKTHPTIGLRMLAGHPLAALVRDAVHLHHERPDGQGYPQGLHGAAVPVMARIVGICDAFDAMTSHRPYRQGMPIDQALGILRQERGVQFDTSLVDVFIALGEAGQLNHVCGHSDEGIPLQSCPLCGPTLVLRCGLAAGEKIYCRNCAGEFELDARDAELVARPTGRKGSAENLEPEADVDLIRRTVSAAVATLPVRKLMEIAMEQEGAA